MLCGSQRFGSALSLTILLFAIFQTVVLASEEVDEGGEEGSHGHEIPPAHALLFPSFTLTIGVLVFYVLSRYAHALPYTAVMFLIGTLMGVGAALSGNENQLNESISQWTNIDSEVLLLVFLPGLIFKDAIGQSVHLFRIAMSQLLIFAFPMVLAGTTITAVFAYYVLPYDWSFNLCMTFGSILCATDPVAVAALLEQVGAPPRLKVHVAGESLLNDGSAIVFFAIFSERFFYELNVEDIGEDVGLGRGVGLFLQKSLGGVAIGIFFALGLLFLMYTLKRRFNREENVVEVTATIAVAYVGYYTAEVVFKTSGVISTVTTGLLVNFMGRGFINDADLLDDFFGIVEHLLNTILFTLGGAVWGDVIANGEKDGTFRAREWGYLVLLYVLLHVIRGALFTIAYPITARIGLKTSWQETAFQIYGGLRGAVGIALAIALDNEVNLVAGSVPGEGEGKRFQEQTATLFGFVGGIAFLTLCINGTTAGPFLIRLGLADSTATRERIIEAYKVNFRSHLVDQFVELLTYTRFKHVNFAVVKHHVPDLADLTKQQLMEAVHRHSGKTLPEDYVAPNLVYILPYLDGDDVEKTTPAELETVNEEESSFRNDSVAKARKVQRDLRKRNRERRRNSSTLHFMMTGEPMSSQELRTLFLSILRAAYANQIREGELEDRKFLAVMFEQSLDFALDEVEKGQPINDWQYVIALDDPYSQIASRFQNNSMVLGCLGKSTKLKRVAVDAKSAKKRLTIERSLSFMAAHRHAQRYFVKEFSNTDTDLSEAGKLVLQESKEQFEKANAVLKTFDRREVETVASHKFCMILLNAGIFYVGKLVGIGLLKESEAEHWVEHLEEELRHVLSCDELEHPGEISIKEEGDELNASAHQSEGSAHVTDAVHV